MAFVKHSTVSEKASLYNRPMQTLKLGVQDVKAFALYISRLVATCCCVFAAVSFSVSLDRQLACSFIRLQTWLRHLLDVCLLVCLPSQITDCDLLHVSCSSVDETCKQSPASVAGLLETQCAPTETVCRRSQGSIPRVGR